MTAFTAEVEYIDELIEDGLSHTLLARIEVAKPTFRELLDALRVHEDAIILRVVIKSIET